VELSGKSKNCAWDKAVNACAELAALVRLGVNQAV
jgi:hypothetical protein